MTKLFTAIATGFCVLALKSKGLFYLLLRIKKSYSHPTLCYCTALNFIYPSMKSACFPWFIDLKCAGWLSERKPRSNEAGSDWPFVYCFDLDCVMLLVISENNYPPFNCARHPSRSQQCWDIIVLSRRSADSIIIKDLIQKLIPAQLCCLHGGQNGLA